MTVGHNWRRAMYRVPFKDLTIPPGVYTINESEARRLLKEKNKNYELLQIGNSWAIRFIKQSK